MKAESALLLTGASAFVLKDNILKIVIAALLSMVPTFEGRYAIVAMLGMGMPPVFAYLLAVVFSTLPSPIILYFLRPVFDWFLTLPFKPLRAFVAWMEKRTEKKRASMMEKAEKTDKKGNKRKTVLELIGLYIFVALPLPGTGCWTGSAIAALTGMPKKRSLLVIFLGNLTACAVTALATLGISVIV